jgi:hypothetical protein
MIGHTLWVKIKIRYGQWRCKRAMKILRKPGVSKVTVTFAYPIDLSPDDRRLRTLAMTKYMGEYYRQIRGPGVVLLYDYNVEHFLKKGVIEESVTLVKEIFSFPDLMDYRFLHN